MLEYFKQYIKITRGVTDSTVKHYITALNTINSILTKYDFPIRNIFDSFENEHLDLIKNFLDSNEEFIKKDTIGNRMYSVAFNHFYRFALEDTEFYKKKLDKMDIAIPKKIISLSEHRQRNRIIASQALEYAHYECECNEKHITFISASTGKQYMEGHHLIPIRYQEEFQTSLDVYANIICLCPICHRLLHYGTVKEKEYAADKLFDSRKERLIHSGIDVSINNFRKLIV